jgi:hypothetical protein
MKKQITIAIIILLFSCALFANGIWIWDTEQDWEGNTYNIYSGCTMTDCNTMISPGKVKILNVLNDEFNSTDLNSNWIWENKNLVGNSYNFISDLDSIRLICGLSSSWWCLSNGDIPTSSHIYQYADYKRNFEAETCLKQSSMYNHQWGGISFYISDINRVNAYRIGYESYQNGVDIDVRSNCSNEVRLTNYGTYYPVYFKIKNEYISNMNNISFSYKTSSGGNWISTYTYSNKSFNQMFIGIEKSDTDQKQYADFDYFHVTGGITKTATVLSKWVNLGSAPVGTGTISWEGNYPGQGNLIKVKTQTSDDGVNTPEPWSGEYGNAAGSSITSANRKYIRFMVELDTEDENNSPELNKVSITYPNMAPNKPVIHSASHPADTWTNSNTAYFDWSGSDSNGVTVAAYYYDMDNVISIPGSPSTTNKSVVFKNVAEGIHTFHLAAQADASNNNLVSETADYVFRVDTTNPRDISVIQCSHNQLENSTNNNFSIVLNLQDGGNPASASGIKGVSYIMTKNSNDALDDLVDGSSNTIVINGLDNGVWYFKARAVDNAGNAGNVLQYAIKIEYKGKVLDENGVKIFPNPASSVMNLQYELAGTTKKVSIEIHDAGGRLKKTLDGTVSTGINSAKENISGWANGVYFVKIIAVRDNGGQDIVVKKLVIIK